jgi:hypothetical protein
MWIHESKMKYQTCLKSCIANARLAGATADIAMYQSYPQPIAKEWEACLKDVVSRGDDSNDPFACMASYELRLSKRGVRTVLGCLVDELKAAAQQTGIPHNYTADLIALWATLNSK